MAEPWNRIVVALWLLAASTAPAAAQPADGAAGSLAAGSAASLTTMPDAASLSLRGAFYVPAYTSLLLGGRVRIPVDLTVTLLVHNTSGTKPLVVERIAYYDTAGRLVQDYLTAPVAVRPFGTVEAFVPVNDARGGTGANFVVSWAAAGAIAEPVMETLIVGGSGTQGYSFVGQGRPIRMVEERR